MTIETKYTIGEEVWVDWLTMPTKMVVQSIEFKKYAHAEYIGYFVVNPNDRRDCFDAQECELFPTKEELLKSL